jgi:hypothetical protein
MKIVYVTLFAALLGLILLSGCELEDDFDAPAVDPDDWSADEPVVDDPPVESDTDSEPVSEPTQIITGSLEVFVYDEAGGGLSSARVCLKLVRDEEGEEDVKVDERNTDSDGIAYFEGLRSGTYRVILDQPRYLALPTEVEVEAGMEPEAELFAVPGLRSGPSGC